MKNVIFAMTLIAIAFSSCQKQAGVLPLNSSSTASELSTDATHYYHGEIVTHHNQIGSYLSEQSAILFTDLLNGKPEYYYFDTQDEELEFMNQHAVLSPAYSKLQQAKDMHTYAVASGEVEHFQQTGEISQSYLEYCNKYRTRAFYTLYDGLLGVGPSRFIGGPIANLGGIGFDNRAESYAGNFNLGTIFTNPFFGGLSLTFANGTPYPVNTPPRNLPPAFRNTVSSAN